MLVERHLFSMALKSCKECGGRVSKSANSCPQCGAVLKRKHGCFAKIVIAIIFIYAFRALYEVLTVTIPGVIPSDPSSSEDVPKQAKLEVIDFKWGSGEFGERVLTGTVRNNTSKQYNYVQVYFNLYDASGNQVGNSLANIAYLEPHGTWRFEAVVLEDKAQRATLKEVTGF